MSNVENPNRPATRVNYGIDAPEVVRLFFTVGIAGILGAIGAAALAQKGILVWLRLLVWPGATMGLVFLAQGLVMLWGSKRGKLLLRDRVMASISWRGDERVLDVGCGHGLLLIAAAKRLRTGRAIGIDLWQKQDQSGNSRDATWQNVRLEKVADRVELKDGDARKLPFADNTFDVVLSSWALHNIYDAAGRETALREIARVLKRGGRAVIIDIRHTAEYLPVLESCGLQVKRHGPNFLFVIPSFTLAAMKS